MQKFYCNKRFDISFSDFHKLVKLILPSTYSSKESRGIYKKDYVPCNILTIVDNSTDYSYNIYCWLGKKGLTILADTEFATSICIEVLKEVKQNAEDYRMQSFDIVDEVKLIEQIKQDYLVYHQLNSSYNTSKYIIKEYNNDEVTLEFFYEPEKQDADSVRLQGAMSSLFTYVQLLINKLLNDSFLNKQDAQE